MNILRMMLNRLKDWLRIKTYQYALFFAKIKTALFYKSYSSYDKKEGDIELSRKKLCIFSSFDPLNRIDDYVIFYLQALEKAGFSIVFVTTSPISNEEALKVKPYVSLIIRRANLAFDFASFKAGLDSVGDYRGYDLLLFANDSVYGPLHPLNGVMDFINSCKYDVVGITDSYEYGAYHLQSYFLCFKNKVFTSDVFKSFFSNFKYSNNKTFIVNEYEIGLSRILKKAGFELGAFCDYLDLSTDLYRESEDKYLQYYNMHKHLYLFENPCLSFWKIGIGKFKCPFIKKSLIISTTSSNILDWPDIIEETGYDINLIKNHLKYMSNGLRKI